VNSQHSGNMQFALNAVVDNVLAIHGPKQREPWEIIASARAHLADQVMDEADVFTWWELGKYQDCFLGDKTDLCVLCGEMEGLHRMGLFCRKQDLMSGACRVSPRFAKLP